MRARSTKTKTQDTAPGFRTTRADGLLPTTVLLTREQKRMLALRTLERGGVLWRYSAALRDVLDGLRIEVA